MAKKGELIAVWTVYTASLEEENKALKNVIQQLHDEIVAQDEEYKALGEMNLKLLEEIKKLKSELAEQIDWGNGMSDEIEFRKRRTKELEAIIEHWKKYEEWIQKLRLRRLDDEEDLYEDVK